MCVGLKRSDVTLDKAGGDDAEDTPVPIPNTEVKLRSADDTWRATARESRKLPAEKNNRSARVGYFLRGARWWMRQRNFIGRVGRLRNEFPRRAAVAG